MKNVLIIVAVIAVAVLGWFVFGNKTDKASETINQQTNETTNEPTTSTETPVSENKITISGFAFNPSKITVKKGTTVTWTNQDSTQHNVEPDEPSDDFKRSELLAKDESYSFTFEKSGTYSYHCQPHPQMKGTVDVTEN